MDDSTKTMAYTLAVGAVKKLLMTAGTAAAAQGIISGGNAETYAGIAAAVVGVAFSFWTDYGKAIVLSQLEVLKARSLAAAKKIQDAGLKPVSVAEVADQSSTLTAAQVIKVAATMPDDVHASVIPLAKVG